MAKRVHLTSAVLIGSLLHAGTVYALGLGDITLKSYLNEPLNAEVRLIDTRDLVADEIKVRLAGVDDFERLGIDRSYFLTRIQFEVSIDRDSNSGVIRLTTQEPVLEPFVDVVIEARWPSGRLLREYTVLVDPPVFREEPLVVSASEEVAASERASREPETPSEQLPAVAPAGGDRVSARRSDLPAGEMPRRPFSAETAETPVAGQRYMVRRDETLWQIASRGRPEGSSVQQAMLDIQRLNPEAFIEGNINRIKAGYIIYLPAQGDISSDDLAEALAEVQQQNADWAGQRAGTPGVTTAASLRISADPVEEGPAAEDSDAQVADSGPVAPAEAEEPGAVTGGADSQVEPGNPEDAVAAGEAAGAVASSELAGQMAEMAERLDTLEQIVALKDEQIATLERALREARSAPQQSRDEPAPAAGPAPQSAPTPAAEAPAGGLSSLVGPWLYAALGVLLAGLLGLLFWRRRRDTGLDDDEALVPTASREADAEDVFAGVTLRDEPPAQQPPAEPAVATAPGPAPAAPAAPRDNRGYGERRYDDYIDDSDAGDALAEADIYIAYGRYLQAAELLNTAIEGEPGNIAYRLKLIELYVDMGEPVQAEEQLIALRELGDEDAVQRGEAIVGGSLAPPVTEPDATREAETETEPEAEPEIDDEAEVEAEPYAVEGSEPDTLGASEYGFDGDDERAQDAPSERPLSVFADETVPEVPYESQADASGSVEADASDDGAASASVDDDAYRVPPTRGDEPLEFTLEDITGAGGSSPSVAADAAGPEASESALAGSDPEALELELDFDELAIEEDGYLSGADVDDDELDLTDALREADAPAVLPAQDADSDEQGSEDLLFAADADQVATRLDLARAYLDMGDDEGARRILEQVLSEGTDEQQREAQALLDRIG